MYANILISPSLHIHHFNISKNQTVKSNVESIILTKVWTGIVQQLYPKVDICIPNYIGLDFKDRLNTLHQIISYNLYTKYYIDKNLL